MRFALLGLRRWTQDADRFRPVRSEPQIRKAAIQDHRLATDEPSHRLIGTGFDGPVEGPGAPMPILRPEESARSVVCSDGAARLTTFTDLDRFQIAKCRQEHS